MKLTVRGLPQLSTRAMHPIMVDMPFLGYVGVRTRDLRMIIDLVVDLPVPILGVQGDLVGFVAEVTFTPDKHVPTWWAISALGYVNHSRPRGHPSISMSDHTLVDDGDGRVSLVGARLSGVQLLADEIRLWDDPTGEPRPIPPLRGVPPAEQKARRW